MTRFVSTSNQTATEAASVRLFVAVSLDFPSGMVRAHDGTGTISFGGNDYLGVGQFGTIAAVKETSSVVAQSVNLTLSGVDPTLLSTIGTGYQGRSAVMYFGLLDQETNLPIATPEELWSGRIDTMSVSMKRGEASISLNCEPRLRREPRIARYTHQDLQLAYSGDRFFDLIGKISGFVGTWGNRGVANDGGTLGMGFGSSYSGGDALAGWRP
jgi:hypothetical protein